MALQKNRINQLFKSKDSSTFPFSKTDGNLASNENIQAFYNSNPEQNIGAFDPKIKMI